ncbi:MAG: substrate-binding domain-containing protein [Lachnospiraceae bacterium]|nr:substrate-binding domain-containing protein [Lachnospiraceae bacterium]
MKHTIALALTIIMIIGSLTACAGNKGQVAISSGKGIDIGIVLPTNDEDRWIADEIKFHKIIEEKGLKAEIMYSQSSPEIEKANVEALIKKGIQVLLLCPVDEASAASTVQMAKTAGIQVISYDRLITDTEGVDYYVAFESIKNGEAKGEYICDWAAKFGGKGLNLYLYSGALSDNNSSLFFTGCWNILQPKLADGTFICRNSEVVMKYKNYQELTHDQIYEIMHSIDTEWDPKVAKALAELDLAKASKDEKEYSFIVAPNDDTARAIADAFIADKDVKEYRLCGADGVESSVQYIIDGKQDMTVYCDPEMITKSAMDLAVKLLSGEKVNCTEAIDNGKVEIPVVRCPISTITRDNLVEVLLDSGVYDKSQFRDYEGISDDVKADNYNGR